MSYAELDWSGPKFDTFTNKVRVLLIMQNNITKKN